MATGDKRTLRLYGPWRGVNQQPGECVPGECEDAWNVDFVGDIIETRRGRKQLVSAVAAWPVQAWRYGEVEAVTFRTDATLLVSDGDPTTALNLDGFGFHASDRLYIGMVHPFSSLFLFVSSPNQDVAALTVRYLSMNTGLTAVSGFADGTMIAGVTLSQPGTLSWTMPTDWWPTTVISPPTAAGNAPSYRTPLHWIEIATSAVLSGGTRVAEIYTQHTLANGMLKGANGLYQWRRSGGERLLVVGMDDREAQQARLYALDRFTRRLRPFTISAGAGATSGRDARWVFATVRGELVAANGYVLLHSVPRSSPGALEMRSFGAVTLKAGSSRRTSAPRSAMLVAYTGGRLIIVDRNAPNTVRISDDIGASEEIDATQAEIPLGGAHVWDPAFNLTVRDIGGGPITALQPHGGDVLIFTPHSTHRWNGEVGGAAVLREVDPFHGCVAPRSVVSVAGRVLFLSASGVVATQGEGGVLISRRVGKTIDNLNRNAVAGAVAAAYLKRTQYRLHVPSGPDGRNNIVLVYDWTRDVWTQYGVPPFLPAGTVRRDYHVQMVCSAYDEEVREELLTTDYDGYLWLEDIGVSDEGRAILSVAVFDRIKFEDQSVATCRYARAQVLQRGPDTGLSLGVALDGRDWRRTTSVGGNLYLAPGEQNPTLGQRDLDANAADQVYGTPTVTGVVLGTGTWRHARFAQSRASFGLTGRVFQPVLYCDPGFSGSLLVRQRVAVRGLELEFRPRAEKRAEP